jgi:hypothetical protein
MVNILEQLQKYKYFVVGVILLFILIKLINKYRSYKRRNPVFYKNGRDGRKKDMIDDIYIVPSDQFTYSFFIYIDNWDYLINRPKIILAKASEDLKDGSFICGLTGTVNNFFVVIKTEEKNSEVKITIEDFPLKKWTCITLLANDTLFEVYMNGKLVKSTPLHDYVKKNKYPLYICPYDGFGGYISKLRYSNRALSNREIYEMGKSPLFDYNIIKYALNSVNIKNINICGESYDLNMDKELTEMDKSTLLALGNVIDPNDENLTYISKNYADKMFEIIQEHINDNTENAPKPVISCPSKRNAPDCPLGTLACDNDNKYCYYPNKDVMVSTYIDTKTDYCPTDNDIGIRDGAKPITINGTNVWVRKPGSDSDTCKNLKVFNKTEPST